MRLRFRKFDYFIKAAEATRAPFFLVSHEEIMEEEETTKCIRLMDELMASSVNVYGLSCIEKLSFSRAHKQFLSSILPQNYEESRAKRGQHQTYFFISDGKESAISAKCFELEPPEVELSQEQTILPQQIMLELGCMPLILIETDLTSCSQQVIFKKKIDNAISLDMCSFPPSSDKFLDGISNYKDIICIEKEREDMNNFMLERSSPGEGKSSRFLKCVGSPFQFELYEVDLDNYDLQAVREAFFLLDPEDQINQFEQQTTILLDAPELPCSMHFDSFDYFNIEHSLDHISEEQLKISRTYKVTLHETEISAAHIINSGDNSGTTKGELAAAAQMQMFEVLDLLDGNYIQTFDLFRELMEAIQVTFEESTESNVKSQSYFDELVAVPELNLTDSTFKSLPTPVFCDDEEDLSCYVINILLNQYKQYSASASDWLYLDWHQSKGGACNNRNCFSIQEKMEDEQSCRMINFRVISIKMTTDVLSAIEYFEQCQDNYPPISVIELPESVSISDITGVKAGTVTNVEQEIYDLHIENSQKNTLKSNSKVSSLFNSMSVSSDLSFFMNARRGSIRGEDPPAKEISNSKNFLCPDLDKPISKLNFLSNGDFQEIRVQLHHVEISRSVLEILDSLQAKFDTVLSLDHDLKRAVDTFPNLNKLCMLNSSQVYWMSLIKNRASKNDSLEFDSVLRGLVTMHVLQKTAFHVCFYGVRVAHLYTKKLVQSIDFLEDSIQPPYSLLKDEYHKSENGLIEEHPMISLLERILKSDFSPQCGYKILLVAERKLFLTLHKKMTAMNLKLHEFVYTDKLGNQWPDCGEKFQLNQAVRDALAHYDCLIVSHSNVNSSFPFEQFNIIVEYDDSHLSSHVSYTIGRIAHKCNVHLVRVEVKGKRIMPLFTEALKNLTNSITEEGKACWLSSVLQEDALNHERMDWQLTDGLTIDKDSLQTSLNTGSKIEGKVLESNLCTEVTGSHEKSPVRSASGELYFSHGNKPQLTAFPHMIIITNIREFDDEMLCFCRNSYQKILALEKEGLQVVEREYHLPVDLIFSTSICLIRYTARKLRHYKSVLQDYTISTCIENVADSILMSLSFSFQDCIMIFEGEEAFLTEVVKASDDLYASAVGLGIHLQCFLSGSSETTDHIVLNCIRTRKPREVACPAMMESETLGECFLMKFPSINPLTAHVVLSCADTLSEFICLTHGHQICSMKKIDLSEKSAILFSALCKHGELGETKSCTTDCSSTLTSPFDADSNGTRTEINSDKMDSTVNILVENIPENDCLDTDTSILSFGKYKEISFESFKLQPSQISQRSNKWNSKPFEWVDNHDHHTNNQRMEGLNWGCTLDHDTAYTNSDLVDELDPPVVKNSCGDAYGESVSIYKDFQKGAFGKPQCNISSGFNNFKFNTEYPLLVSLDMRNASKTARSDEINQSEPFQNNLQQFPSPTKVNRQLDPWNSSNESMLGSFDAGETRKQPQMKNTIAHLCSSLEMDCWRDEMNNWKKKSIKNALERSELTKHQKFYTNSTNAFIGKRPGLSYVQHKLRGSKKILHAVPNEYSSAGEKKSVLEYPSCVSSFCPSPSPSLRYNTRSPSIFDNYQYKSEVESRIACKRKWQNLLMYPKKSPGMKRQKNLESALVQSWTPVDKRAKQTLTFVKGGSNKQSRLVWSDTNTERIKKRRVDKRLGI